MLCASGCSVETTAPVAAPAATETSEAKPSACPTERLAVGESRALPSSDLRAYSVARAGIVDLVPTEMKVTGRRAGTTDVRLVGKSGESTCVRYEVASGT